MCEGLAGPKERKLICQPTSPDFPYQVRGGVAFDAASRAYQACAVNNLGNLLLYKGLWEDDETLVFTLVYPQHQADTRVSYIKVSDDTVRMTLERVDQKGGTRNLL